MTSPSKELRDKQQQLARMNGLRAALQTVDRAISGSTDVRVKLQRSGRSAPAYTDGKTIFLNSERLAEVFEQGDRNAVLVFKGTNYHELGHVMFTPRQHEEFTQWIMANRHYKWAANALEDQRIETMYTALYPPTVPYFRNSTYRWLLNNSYDDDRFYRVYSLISGRLFVDRDIRMQARAAFAAHYGLEATQELDAIVQEYVSLPLPAKTEEAKALVIRFHKLLKDSGLDNYTHENTGDCGGHGATEEGEISPEKIADASNKVQDQQEQERQQDEEDARTNPPQPTNGEQGQGQPEEGDEAEEDGEGGGSDAAFPEDQTDGPSEFDGWGEDDDALDDMDDEWDDEDDDTDGDSTDGDWGDQDGDDDSDDGDDGDGGQEGDDGSDGDSGGSEGEAEGDTSDGESHGESDGPVEAPTGDEPQPQVDDEGDGGNEAGHGDSEPPGPSTEDLRDTINERLADALTDEGLQTDLDRTCEAIQAHVRGAGGEEEATQYEKFDEVDADPEVCAVVEKITRELKDIKTDQAPEWLRERQVGSKVNMDNVIRRMADPTHMDIFEQWDQGTEEEAKTEVVLTIDLSGSMRRVMHRCSEALWLLKKAFDNCDIPTTVLGFSDGNVVLYKKGEKLRGRSMRSFGTWAGTDAQETMLYAHRVLSNSDATNKVLVAITDGAWTDDASYCESDGARPSDIVADLRRQGCSTLLFGVNNHRCSETHNFEVVADFNNIDDIVKIVRGLVTKIQERAAKANAH